MLACLSLSHKCHGGTIHFMWHCCSTSSMATTTTCKITVNFFVYFACSRAITLSYDILSSRTNNRLKRRNQHYTMRTIQDIAYLVIWLSRKSVVVVVVLFFIFQFLIFTQPHDGNVSWRALYKSIENMLGDIFYDNIWNMDNFFYNFFL